MTHRLVSPFILEKYAANESNGSFSAASLFVDMSGFSTMTSKLMEHGQHGAEVMAIVMRAIFDPLVEAVYAHGGFITTFAGDAFTAVFPLNHAAPQETYAHALAAAWSIRHHMRSHREYDTEYGKFEVGVKIGMAAGEVTWGILRSEDDTRAAFYFRGPAIDASAHAEHQANKGDLILHSSAVAELGDNVEITPLADENARVEAVNVSLPDAQPIELPTPDDPTVLARFFPRSVIQQISSGEFREAITIFLNVRGTPSDAQLEQFMATIFKLQAKYGGLFNRLDFGDKGCSLLLFWGAPISHENDVLRALNFLLELHDETRLSIRAGITSRISHAGFIGSNLHEEYTCYGNGVNLAARLMTSAPWETFWIDEQIRLRAEYQFLLEREGEYKFKGFDENQAVYALLGRKPAEVLDTYERPMVGRTEELTQLTNFIQPLQATAGNQRFAGILTIEGEAGVGKSRLVHEFIQSQRVAETCAVFVAQADEILHLPLNPFIYWLRTYFDQSPAQSEAHNRRAFSRKLNQLLSELSDATLRIEIDRTHSILGALLDLHWDDSLYERLDPQSRYENTLSALKNLLLAESLRRPVILLLEDAHWLDEDSIIFIERLVRNVDHYPLAILATARPSSGKHFFGSTIAYQTLELTTLSTEAIDLLAAELLGGPVSPALSALLTERAAGNPFFAEQILLYLRDEGLIEHANQLWHVETSHVALLLPSNVRAVFIARLDRLTHEVKDVVQTAAVLGREFEINVLSHMLQHEGLSHHVIEAADAAIWSALTEIRYLFKHVLLRDAAYDMQVRTRRAMLHQLAGHAIETVFNNDLSPHYPELAYHYEIAYQGGLSEVGEKAKDYLKKAGMEASERYENIVAIDYLTRALALISEEQKTERFALLIERQQIYGRRGQRDAQAADIAAAEALAETLNDDEKRSEVALRRARHAEDSGDFHTALAAAQQCVTFAQAAGNLRLEADGNSQWADSLYRLSEFQASIERNEAGLLIARAHGLRLAEGDMLNGIAFNLDSLGRYAEATQVCNQALEIFRELNNIGAESGALNSLGILAFEMGNFNEARRLFEQALDIARTQGKMISMSRYLANLGETVMRLGDLITARETIADAIIIFREIGNREGEAIAGSGQGVLYTKLGDFSQAQLAFEQAVAVSQTINNPLVECEALAYFSALNNQRGECTTAQEQAVKSIALAQKLGAQRQEGIAQDALGHARIGLGDLSAAQAAFRAAIALRETLGELPQSIESRAGLAKALLVAGDIAAAQAETTRIEEFMAEHRTETDKFGLEGTEDALQVLWIVHQVQAAVRAPQAEETLQQAHALLQTKAVQLMDAAERQRFLQAIPHHRDIIAAHEKATPRSTLVAPEIVAAEPTIDLNEGNLAYAKLAGETLSGLDLRGADLNHADLRRANLSRSDLRGADLSYANLRGADACGVDLRRADLTAADLRGVDFTGANLRGADLTDALSDQHTRWPAGFEPES